MQASDIPSKFNIPFANSAGAGFVRTVPQASEIGVNDGWASLTDGFPPLNFQPIGSGGVPPFGQDMNGIIKQITLWSRWQGAGGQSLFDSVFSAAVGGYPQGALLAATTLQGFWVCLLDNNNVNPNTSANPFQDGWLFFGTGSSQLVANVTFYVNGSLGSDSYDGSSATHTSGTIGPFATLQHAVNVVAKLNVAGFVVTVNVAFGTGTYAPFFLGTPINGTLLIAASGGPTISNSTTGVACVTANGFGVGLTITGFVLVNGGASAGNGLLAQAGGTINFNTINFGACTSGAHVICDNGNVNCLGSYTISGNATWHVLAQSGGGAIMSPSTPNVVTLTGSPGFVTTYQAQDIGYIRISSGITSFSGSASVGQRYNGSGNSVIQTAGGGASFLPGTTAGATASGGQYL